MVNFVGMACLMTGIALAIQEPDLPSLVEQLGADRYADRQKAAATLLELGGEALPALRSARGQSRDAEVRNHAGALVESIESRLLTEPTRIRLDFRDAPLPQIVKGVAERSKMPLTLTPENNPLWQSRPATLEAEGPQPFWAVIDRLCQVGGLQYQVANEGGMGGRATVLRLFAGAGDPGPTFDSGPFRSNLVSVHLHRDLSLVGRRSPSNLLIAPPDGIGNVPALPGGIRLQGAGATGTLNEQFYARMQVRGEPRLSLAADGPVRLIEAVDDQGHSLLPAEVQAGRGAGRTTTYGFAAGSNASVIEVQVGLKFPESPGQRIARLRGVVPVSVTARRPEPLTLDLADAAGKSLRTNDLLVQVMELKADPNQGQLLDLTIVQVADTNDPNTPQGAGITAFRSPEAFRGQIEVVDAQGRPLTWFSVSNQMQHPGGSRMTLRLMPGAGEGMGVPTLLRVYELSRARAEVAFEFADVPMPLPLP